MGEKTLVDILLCKALREQHIVSMHITALPGTIQRAHPGRHTPRTSFTVPSEAQAACNVGDS
eukprot:5282016-Pyramimonas_sp.AAC.1